MASAGTVSTLAPYVSDLAATWDREHGGERWVEVEATCCYVDISGFTALSERLAQHGRRGAEEVTERLDGVFRRMLGVAGARGGSLLKFGGDSLLLAFTGTDHALRATEAAVGMRDVLGRTDLDERVTGAIRLRSSMGVHTGTFQLCFVGSSHRELLVVGPAASLTMRLEEEATAGEILVSDATAALLPRSATAPCETSGGRRLRWRTPRPTTAAASGPVAQEGLHLDDAVPVGLRDHLRTRVGASEHRLVTVAFLRCTGVDALLASQGPDRCCEQLERLVTTVQHAADGEGVTFLASDVEVGGLKIILVAGAPTAREDDEGRMLRTLHAIAATPLDDLSLQIGVHRAAVFAGDVGAPTRRTYTVMGDGVNLAARLATAAGPSQVLVTADVLDRSRSTFEMTALDPLTLKGKAVPVLAWALGHETGVQAVGSDELPFVGRPTELAELARVVASGGIATVSGDRGVGKTRLVRELCQRMPGRQLITIQGEPFGRGTPYLAMRQAVRELVGVDELDPVEAGRQLVTAMSVWCPPDVLALAPLLAPVVRAQLDTTPEVEALDDRFIRRRTAELLATVLDARVPNGAILVAEDAHWFDDTTTEVVTTLATLVAERGWTTVVTRRPGQGGYEPAAADATVTLGPLPAPAARELVDAATTATPLRPRERDALLAQAGGNPLFLGELLRVVRTTGSDALPDSLDAIAMREIDELRPDVRRVLVLASVLGRGFERSLLERLVAEDGSIESDDVVEGLDELLVEEAADQLSFRHALLQEAAYDSLPFRERVALHRRAGEAIEASPGGGSVTALSFHFAAAEDWPRTWRYARAAADAARAAHAPGEQAEHLERAIAAARWIDVDDPTVGGVRRELGEALVVLGEFDRADATFAIASRHLRDDVVATARLAERRAYLRTEFLGQPASAIRLVRLGLRALQAVTTAEGSKARAALHTREADVRTRQGRLREGVRLSQAAIEECELVGDERSLALALSLLDQGLTEMGRVSEATHLPRALAIYEALGETTAVAMMLSNLGSVEHYRFEWGDAATNYLGAIDAAIAAGDVGTAAIAQVNLGELRVNQGSIDEATQLLRESLRTFESFGDLVGAATARAYLGRARVLAGDVDEGLVFLRTAIESFDAAGIAIAALDARIALAEALVRAHALDEAAHALLDARTRERALGDTSLALPLERATLLHAFAAGAGPADGERLAAAIEAAREADARYDLFVLLALARGGTHDDEAALEVLTVELGVVAVPIRV